MTADVPDASLPLHIDLLDVAASVFCEVVEVLYAYSSKYVVWAGGHG